MWASIIGRLYLGHGTLASISPPEFVVAAATAGFRRISLKVLLPKPATPVKILGNGSVVGDSAPRRATRQRLDETELSVTEAEAAVLSPDSKVRDYEGT
jgi:hypothetical protein